MNPSSKSKPTKPCRCAYGNCWKCRENMAWEKAKMKQTTKPKKDWVDKLIDSGLTGHKPKKKVKQTRIDGDHQHFDYCKRAWSSEGNCSCRSTNKVTITEVGGRRKGRL